MSLLFQPSKRIRSYLSVLRQQLRSALGVLALAGATCASALPVTWTLNNVVTVDGVTLTGSFVFDASLPAGPGAFSAVNITATGPGGNGPFTQSLGVFSTASLAIFSQSPAGMGQFSVFFSPVTPMTNAGGVLVLNPGMFQSGLGTCADAGCTTTNATVGRNLASGSIVATVPTTVVTTVPTLNQWGLLVLGLLIASFAAWQVRRAGRR